LNKKGTDRGNENAWRCFITLSGPKISKINVSRTPREIFDGYGLYVDIEALPLKTRENQSKHRTYY
jgi:hypothetical protein